LFTLAKLNVYALYASSMNSMMYGYSFETLLNNIKSNKNLTGSRSATHGVSRSSGGGGHRGGVDHHLAGCGLVVSSHPVI
jgi:hypothetical protein